MDPELIAYLDRRFDEAADRVDRRFDDVDQRIREVHILVEAMDHKIELVAEGVVANNEATTALRAEMERQFDDVKVMNRLSYAEIDRRLRGTSGGSRT
jgi:hypothetical protein